MTKRSSSWRAVAALCIFVGLVLMVTGGGFAPLPHLFAAVSFMAIAAAALALSILLPTDYPDVSDVAIGASLSAIALMLGVRGVPASFAMVGLGVAAFAVIAAIPTFAVDPQTGRRWPNVAGWRLIFWDAAPSLALIAFGVGIQAASPGAATSALHQVAAVGLAAVPACRRPAGSGISLVIAIASGAIMGLLTFLLGASPPFAGLVGLAIGVLVWSLDVSLVDRRQVDSLPRPVETVIGLIAVAVLLGALAAGAGVVSVLLPD